MRIPYMIIVGFEQLGWVYSRVFITGTHLRTGISVTHRDTYPLYSPRDQHFLLKVDNSRSRKDESSVVTFLHGVSPTIGEIGGVGTVLEGK